MDGGPLAQHGRVKSIDQKRDDKPHVALVEVDRAQHFEAAVADDDNDASERDADAGGLPQRQAIAEQRESPHRHE
jgi:hypothetical protein